MEIKIADHLKNRSCELLDRSLSFFSNNFILGKDFDPKEVAKKCHKFLNIQPGHNGAIIFGFTLIWIEDILIDGKQVGNTPTKDEVKIYLNLHEMLQELKMIAAEEYAKNGEGFIRMVDPPKEAYEYKGHSKLDIIPSKIASALLYGD